MTTPPTYAVIMAGGSGTRFWPASRRTRPKQLLPLGGGEALLREAVKRIAPLCGHERIYIATGSHLAEATQKALPELAPEQLLIEPQPRNTAPCIGWAAATIARRHPDAVVMALPSDPHILDDDAFRATLERACASAATGTITAIGITPTHPETGYGYIEAKAGSGPVLEVERFVEKPDLERAKEFLASGRFYWNAGMFFFRAGDMMTAIREHLPALARELAVLDAAAADGNEADALAAGFAAMPSVSIDHGVMEHVASMAVVPGDFGWTDLGSWLAVSELAERNADGNSGPDNAVWIGARNNHVVDARTRKDKKVIAMVGVDDLVVVDTDDALLVVKREDAQRVRDVVAALKQRGDDDLV